MRSGFQRLLSNSTCAATPWLVYQEKVKTTGVYIRDSTCVPAYAVLLLGVGRCRLSLSNPR
jgi:hypothetical protein